MVQFLINLFKGRNFGAKRSPKWRSVRKAHLKKYPKCEICGRKANIVHHILPVWKFPSEELNPNNLITTCRRDHITWCHMGSYHSWNWNIKEDILRIKNRP